eukprot:3730898-Amphidinium_carterae.1
MRATTTATNGVSPVTGSWLKQKRLSCPRALSDAPATSPSLRSLKNALVSMLQRTGQHGAEQSLSTWPWHWQCILE